MGSLFHNFFLELVPLLYFTTTYTWSPTYPRDPSNPCIHIPQTSTGIPAHMFSNSSCFSTILDYHNPHTSSRPRFKLYTWVVSGTPRTVIIGLTSTTTFTTCHNFIFKTSQRYSSLIILNILYHKTSGCRRTRKHLRHKTPVRCFDFIPCFINGCLFPSYCDFSTHFLGHKKNKYIKKNLLYKKTQTLLFRREKKIFYQPSCSRHCTDKVSVL